MKTKIISCIVILLFVGANLFAQKPTKFSSKTADIDKIKVKLDFPREGRNSKKGGGYSANVEFLNPKPKKVALISFYLYDPACSKAKGQAASMATGKSSVAMWRTSNATAQVHIDGFYKKSIEPLKAGFKEYGIDLLTPDEFLDTDEKKAFYYGFNPESGKKEKTSKKAWGTFGVNVSLSTLKICPSNKGYRTFFVTNEPINASSTTAFTGGGLFDSNRKMTSSLGYELCKGLGVDAVVVCYIVTRKPKKKKEKYIVDAVQLYMIGPNPKSSGPDDKNRGQFYSGTRYNASQLEFANTKKGRLSYDNIGNVMTVSSKKLCNWVMNKAKK